MPRAGSDAQLRHHHHHAERAMRGASQPYAGCPEARSLAGLARGGACGSTILKALLAPFRSDEMICWPVNARVGSVKNNDVSLIEPINAVSH
jgi:hypothetical protein